MDICHFKGGSPSKGIASHNAYFKLIFFQKIIIPELQKHVLYFVWILRYIVEVTMNMAFC